MRAFEGFDLIAFDWYDVHSDRTEDARFLLYLDREWLLCFCEEDRGLARPGPFSVRWRRRISPGSSCCTAFSSAC